MYGPERSKRKWTQLYDECCNLYSSPNVIRVTKLKTEWVRFVAYGADGKYAIKFQLQHLKGRDHLRDVGVAMGWVHQTQGKVKRHAVVNTVINHRVP
jgi:hypothetical protein